MEITENALAKLVGSASQLYSLPDVYIRVRDIIKDPDAELSQLTNVLSSDPGLSARLLRIANSAFYGMIREVDTISRAIQIIGFQHLYDLVIATSITKAFQGISNDIISMQTFWVASTERALICRTLAQKANLKDTERLFVAGLLLDIGHLVIYEHRPEQARQVIEEANSSNRPLHLIEREILGFDAAELGAALTSEWNFPQQFIDLIAYQDQPEAATENKLDVAVAHTAKRLTEVSPEPEAVAIAFGTIDGGAKQLLGLTEESCTDIINEASAGLTEALEFIIPNPST